MDLCITIKETNRHIKVIEWITIEKEKKIISPISGTNRFMNGLNTFMNGFMYHNKRNK